MTGDLKAIYQSANESEALGELDRFTKTRDAKYPQITKSRRNHRTNLSTNFDYPDDIPKPIYRGGPDRIVKQRDPESEEKTQGVPK